MTFLGEMKRRNLFRVGMIYILGGWIVIQLGYVIAGNYNAPPWVMGLFVFLVVAGFPGVMFYAWNFVRTPDGLRRISDLDPGRRIRREAGHKLDIFIIALLAAVIGIVSLERFMPTPPEVVIAEPQAPAEPEPEPVILENSIAVLPFANLSAESDQEYFSDGLSEELLNVLTKVDGLNVASRTSSFAYKGSTGSIQQIARSLRVANILEGSVRKVGNRLRVTAQLIDADTDVHLWSDHFDRELTDIFRIQDEIANAIVAALTAELGIGLKGVSVKSATSNLDAYDLYLKAREMFIARENLPTSWELLQRATVLDPGFAKAWETLSAVHSVATSWFPGDGIDHESLALAAAHRALEIDPGLSMPHAVIGMKHQITGEGYPGAIRSLDKALENDPKNATAWLWRGITLYDMGYAQKALDDFIQCLNVDPGYLNCQQYRALSMLTLGRIQEAVQAFEDTLQANFHSTTDAFVSYYVHTGQRPLAYAVAALSMRQQHAPIRHWIEAIENPDEDHSGRVERFRQWGEPYNLDICDMESLAVALKQYECLPNVTNASLLWTPDSAEFRQTPLFKEFVDTYLMAYWQEHGFPPQCRALGEEDFECD